MPSASLPPIRPKSMEGRKARRQCQKLRAQRVEHLPVVAGADVGDGEVLEHSAMAAAASAPPTRRKSRPSPGRTRGSAAEPMLLLPPLANRKAAPPLRHSTQGGDNVHVCARVRAFLDGEERRLAVRMRDQTVAVAVPQKGVFPFTLDTCFWSADVADPGAPPPATQQDVYVGVGLPVLESVLGGFSAAVIAFGATGSGKTWTMFGGISARSELSSNGGDNVRGITGSSGEDEEEENDGGDTTVGAAAASVVASAALSPSAGLVPRLCCDLCARHVGVVSSAAEAGRCGDRPQGKTIFLSVVEVYLNEAYDLLKNSVRVPVRANAKRGYEVAGVTAESVSSYEDIARLLARAEEGKTVATTKMNAASSRAHTLVMLQLRTPGLPPVKLMLADLAGSERVKQSGAEGLTLEQAKSINLSLMALGNCIEAVVKHSQLAGGGGAEGLPAFRACTLTKLLRDAIAGGARTAVVTTVSPALEHVANTLQALRFADRAKGIRVHAQIVTAVKEAVVVENQLAPESTGNRRARGGRLYMFRVQQHRANAAMQARLKKRSLQRLERSLRALIVQDEWSAFRHLRRMCDRDQRVLMDAHHRVFSLPRKGNRLALALAHPPHPPRRSQSESPSAGRSPVRRSDAHLHAPSTRRAPRRGQQQERAAEVRARDDSRLPPRASSSDPAMAASRRRVSVLSLLPSSTPPPPSPPPPPPPPQQAVASSSAPRTPTPPPTPPPALPHSRRSSAPAQKEQPVTDVTEPDGSVTAPAPAATSEPLVDPEVQKRLDAELQIRVRGKARQLELKEFTARTNCAKDEVLARGDLKSLRVKDAKAVQRAEQRRTQRERVMGDEVAARMTVAAGETAARSAIAMRHEEWLARQRPMSRAAMLEGLAALKPQKRVFDLTAALAVAEWGGFLVEGDLPLSAPTETKLNALEAIAVAPEVLREGGVVRAFVAMAESAELKLAGMQRQHPSIPDEQQLMRYVLERRFRPPLLQRAVQGYAHKLKRAGPEAQASSHSEIVRLAAEIATNKSVLSDGGIIDVIENAYLAEELAEAIEVAREGSATPPRPMPKLDIARLLSRLVVGTSTCIAAIAALAARALGGPECVQDAPPICDAGRDRFATHWLAICERVALSPLCRGFPGGFAAALAEEIEIQKLGEQLRPTPLELPPAATDPRASSFFTEMNALLVLSDMTQSVRTPPLSPVPSMPAVEAGKAGSEPSGAQSPGSATWDLDSPATSWNEVSDGSLNRDWAGYSPSVSQQQPSPVPCAADGALGPTSPAQPSPLARKTTAQPSSLAKADGAPEDAMTALLADHAEAVEQLFAIAVAAVTAVVGLDEAARSEDLERLRGSLVDAEDELLEAHAADVATLFAHARAGLVSTEEATPRTHVVTLQFNTAHMAIAVEQHHAAVVAEYNAACAALQEPVSRARVENGVDEEVELRFDTAHLIEALLQHRQRCEELFHEACAVLGKAGDVNSVCRVPVQATTLEELTYDERWMRQEIEDSLMVDTALLWRSIAISAAAAKRGLVSWHAPEAVRRVGERVTPLLRFALRCACDGDGAAACHSGATCLSMREIALLTSLIQAEADERAAVVVQGLEAYDTLARVNVLPMNGGPSGASFTPPFAAHLLFNEGCERWRLESVAEAQLSAISLPLLGAVVEAKRAVAKQFLVSFEECKRVLWRQMHAGGIVRVHSNEHTGDVGLMFRAHASACSPTAAAAATPGIARTRRRSTAAVSFAPDVADVSHFERSGEDSFQTRADDECDDELFLVRLASPVASIARRRCRGVDRSPDAEALAMETTAAAGSTNHGTPPLVPTPPLSARPPSGRRSERQEQGQATQPHEELSSASSHEHVAEAIAADIQDLRQKKEQLRVMGEVGSPSDAHLSAMEATRTELGAAKVAFAARVEQMKVRARGISEGNDELVVFDFVLELLNESDVPEGNAMLFHVLTSQVLRPAEIVQLLVDHSALATAAADGSAAYFSMLLDLACGIPFDFEEAFCAAAFNQVHRTALLRALLLAVKRGSTEVAQALLLENGAADNLHSVAADVFQAIASKQAVVPKEIRGLADRPALLQLMLELDSVLFGGPLDVALAVGGDGRSIVGRAAFEDDVELLVMLIQSMDRHQQPLSLLARAPPDAPAGMTPLMHAVVGDAAAAVKLLLGIPEIFAARGVKGENGSALDLAIGLGRDASIVELLQQENVASTAS